MAENETVDVLQELIETCRDGENGFREAAEKLMDPEIKNFFIQQSGVKSSPVSRRAAWPERCIAAGST
jgi:uncharacterized protein (TIGR02284 family)